MSIYVKQNRLLGNKVRHSLYPIDTTVITSHINNSTIARLTNKDPNTDRLVYSSQNPYGSVGDAGIWVRNPNCWINGVTNISCFSPAQRSGANWFQRAGTLITRKHFILAKHFVFAILEGGTGIIFVDENNNAIKRNLIQYAYDDLTDIAIGVLDNEVPSNYTFAKVLPPNYQDYIGYPENILAVSLDQQEKAILKVWDGLLGGSYQYTYITSITSNDPSNFQPYSVFSEPIIAGDSGDPSFIIIDNELVLLSCWHFATSGPFVTDRYNKVNELIESLSPNEGYSLTPINLEVIYHKYA